MSAPGGAALPVARSDSMVRAFEVRLLRPTPLGPPVRLTASPVSVDESEVVVMSELEVDGKPRATMTATWLRFRPG